MKIAIASDHAGFDLKSRLAEYLRGQGHDIIDLGTHSTDSTDYPDYAHSLADSVSSGNASVGVLICGSGNGVCMSANKHKNIRAALAWNEEIASLARQHNDANVLCLPARYVSNEEAQKITDAYLKAAFEGGRHQRRVEKIEQ